MRLIVDDRAQSELRKAMRWYESQRRLLGQELFTEFIQAGELLKANPHAGTQYVESSYRFLRLGRFPYVMYFREVPEGIWIVAVAHDRRRPGYWLRRRPKRI